MQHHITTETRRGADGWSETLVRLNGEPIAIIVRPCKGAKWFRDDIGRGLKGVPFCTLKAAIASLQLVAA
jgi:hypothetical protein